MARKRQRKKKRQAETLQVELLGDEATEHPKGPRAEPPDSQVEPAAPSSDAERPSEPREAGERWAKAVGQLRPAPADSGSRTIRRPPLEAERAPEHAPHASGPDATTEDDDGGGVHAPSRDHASAAVRPAGEPLARARDLVQQGRVHEAIELYLGILTVNSSNLKAHNNLGVLLDELKQFEAALEHFEAAHHLAPDNVEVLSNYASTLTSLARYEEAEELLRRAQRLSADDVRARLGIGILYFRRGLYGQAEAELRWVLERDGENGSAHYYRGEALNRLSRFEEAADELKRAIELIPDDPRPYYTLGHLYDRRHELHEAAEMYRTARRLQAR